MELWTNAPAVEGKANEAIRRMIANWLGVPLSSVRVVGGLTARSKTIEVDGLDSLPSC